MNAPEWPWINVHFDPSDKSGLRGMWSHSHYTSAIMLGQKALLPHHLHTFDLQELLGKGLARYSADIDSPQR